MRERHARLDRHSRRVPVTLVLPVVVAVFAAACGSGDGAPQDAGPRSTTTVVAVAAAAAGERASDGEGAAGGATTTVAASDTADDGEAHAAEAAPPAQGSSSASPSTAAGAAQHAVVPRPGDYRYATEGYSESGSGATAQRRDLPEETTDTITVQHSAEHDDVTIVTDFGDGSTQTAELRVAKGAAALRRLAFASTTNGVRSEQSITPQPPITVYRAPFTVGDRWESAWEDSAYGVQGVGTTTVTRRERITTPAGAFDCVVVHLDHRLRGTVSGRLQITMWVDPVSATRIREETVMDLQVAGTASHFEARRDLSTAPA